MLRQRDDAAYLFLALAGFGGLIAPLAATIYQRELRPDSYVFCSLLWGIWINNRRPGLKLLFSCLVPLPWAIATFFVTEWLLRLEYAKASLLVSPLLLVSFGPVAQVVRERQ